jgi:uncharacterized protein
MLSISEKDILVRIARDNPWWADPNVPIPEAQFPRRVYFESLKNLALDFSVKRATVMLGPRRVGKTFMIKQLVAETILSGVKPCGIMYVSIDTPIYSGLSLERFIELMPKDSCDGQRIVIFDEIQYLRNWEVHLKDLVDNYKDIKFIATGSAAAALRLKSQESGAGRFSDFMLPPLTFYEFLRFINEDETLIEIVEFTDDHKNRRHEYNAKDINVLNERFIDYLNFGGYPEAVLNEAIRKNPEQFIRNDIIDKVLLKDLPSLYGIQEIQELNKLFAFLAYNAGTEASLENISQESGITKPTIRRYIEYLESAFLIIKLSNVDDSCKTMKRERNFKVYLNNPSMRAALFAPVNADDTDRIGHLTESAIFSQWQHAAAFQNLRYARWKNEGEVDVVYLSGAIPQWIGEIKWSDRVKKNQNDELKSIRAFLTRHRTVRSAFFTTRTASDDLSIDGRHLNIVPSSLYCYTVGRNITRSLMAPMGMEHIEEGKQVA